MKNFFNNSLNSNNYLKILNHYKKLNPKFVLQNYGSLIGDKSLFRFLTLYELLKKAKKVKGNIIEFGTWNGNSLIFQKKIIEFLKIKKKFLDMIILKECLFLLDQIIFLWVIKNI